MKRRTHSGMKRPRSLGTKVTDDEYRSVLAAAGGLSPSEWLRSIVLARLNHTSLETILLAEMLSLSRFVANVTDRLARKQPLTEELVRQMREHAERDKFTLARAVLQREQS